MRRFVLVAVLLSCLLGTAKAFAATEAELVRLLRSQPADTVRLRLLNTLCHQLHDNEPTRALPYGEQAVALGRQLRYQPGLLQALLNLGNCYANLADGAHALRLQQEALLLARQLRSTNDITRALTDMGRVQQERNDTAAAMRNYQRALTYAYQPGVQPHTQLLLFGNLGNLYFNLRQYPEGLLFTRRALQLARRTGDQAGEAQYLADMGAFYMQMNQLETAEGLLRKAVLLAQAQRNERFRASNLELLATALLLRNQLPEADSLAQQALLTARRIQYKERILGAYGLLAKINAQQGQHEQAYAWQVRHRDLNDSLNSRSRMQMLTALQTRYETAEKERQIKRLTEQEQTTQQRNRALWGTVAALLLGLSGMAYLYTKLRLSRSALAANHRALGEATRELRQLAASKDRLYAIVAHDLRGPVTAFAGVTELIDFYLKKGDEDGLRRLPTLVRQSAYQLNHLLDNLLNWAVNQTGELAFRPERLLVRELYQDTIRLYENAAEAKQITLHSQSPECLAVWADAHMTQTILRNLISNALKFTPAGGSIHLLAQTDGAGTATLCVQDSGAGMTTAQTAALLASGPLMPLPRTARSGTGLGLLLCRAFADRQSGALSITSSPEQGTKVCLTLPAAQPR
ncbi:tetratricopeptide repeat-containing sensor histidine kinase [Hymenobacter sp. UYP22]|uniref:tetratricopeptide repeat-containing sensor histidine kinase n=1 Tax=Hymenobacter sp. UYP22 TaxID=3156348 RepID=UPI00339969D7